MTTEEFIPKNENGMYSRNEIVTWAEKFAKLHVEAALKEASEKVKAKWAHMKDYSRIYDGIDKDSILNSYPLENIK